MLVKLTDYVILLLIVINVEISLANNEQEAEELIVTLPGGKIRGHALQTQQTKTYYAFQQIPYASPPEGNLRFKEPVAPIEWDGILNATENTIICMQNNPFYETPNITQSEDCLYLNVYTTLKPGSSSTLPVLIWIHGGGFLAGDGTFQTSGPQYFMNYDVIVVTFNYRLGPFGFLTTEDGVIPANLGLKDQNFALQWVKTNINLFGGDASKVTIVGESAGAASVGFQLISNKSKGLFRGAILQSGTALCSFAYQSYASYYAFELGRALNPNFTSENSADLLKLLQDTPATDILNANISIPEDKQMGLGDKDLLWTPVIEKEDVDNAFITNYMHEDIKSGNISKVPILLGFNSEEEITFLGDGESVKNLGAAMDRNFSKLINNKFSMTTANKLIAGRKFRQIYTSSQFQKDFGALVRFMSDEGFTTPITRHAELQSNYTDVYLYQLSYKGSLGGLNLTVNGADTVGHAEDLKYMWSDSSNLDMAKFSISDRLTHYRILKLWTNFVKFMNPTPEADPLLENIIWPKVTPSNITYLDINRTLEVKIDPKKYQKVKEIIDRYAEPPLIGY